MWVEAYSICLFLMTKFWPPFSLRLRNILVYVYISFRFSAYQLMNTRVSSTSWLLWTMPWRWRVCKYFQDAALNSFEYRPRGGTSMTPILFVSFQETSKPFSVMATPFDVLQWARIPTPTLFSVLLMVAITPGVRCLLSVVSTCISLVTGDADYLRICPLGICVSPLEKCPFTHFAHFSVGSFCCRCC